MTQNTDLYIEDAELANVEAWDGEFHGCNPGLYELRVAELEMGSSSQKGLPQLVATFEVVANADGTESDMKGRTVKSWYMLTTDIGRKRVRQFTKAVGLEPNARGGWDFAQTIDTHFTAEVYKDQQKSGLDEDGNDIIKTFTKIRKEEPIEAASDAEEPADEADEVEFAPPQQARRTNGNGKPVAARKPAPVAARKPAPRRR